MKIRITTSLVLLSLILVFVLAILISSSFYPTNVRLAPWFVGFPMLVLAIILLIGELKKKVPQQQEAGKKAEEKDDFTSWPQALNTLAWIFGYFVMIFFLGLLVATPIFLVAFFVKKAEMSWIKAVPLAIVSTAIACYLVQSGLEITLWKGAIPKIIPGILGGSIIPPI